MTGLARLDGLLDSVVDRLLDADHESTGLLGGTKEAEQDLHVRSHSL